ncbi:helix-turn-helix domain-containing protein [Enterobacter wuhouensis]|uniref:helix-turn-helix domain-containing protein n=1 Tax=Enterobacter wuhouensis TaxID=2529381 RepID=UPI00352648F7
MKDIDESVSILGEHIGLSKSSYLAKYKKNQRLELISRNNICYLKRGRVVVLRHDNDLVTLTIQAPMILGLTQMANKSKYHYLRCETDCQMLIISNEDATDIFNKKNLWIYAFNILTWHHNLYFQREMMMTHPDIRKVINEHLKYVWMMPPDVRSKTSVYNFIMSRTHISRSAIHKITQEMMKNGSVKIERGKLTLYNDSE